MSDIYQHYMTLPKDNWTNINSFKQGYSDGAMRQCHPNLVGEPLFIYGIMGGGDSVPVLLKMPQPAWECSAQPSGSFTNKASSLPAVVYHLKPGDCSTCSWIPQSTKFLGFQNGNSLLSPSKRDSFNLEEITT